MEAANLGARLAHQPPRRRSTRRSHGWRACRRTVRRSTPGCRRRGTSSRLRRLAPRSGSRPGSTATSRRTCSRPRSRSTSATRCARRSSCRSATPGSSFLPGAAGTVQEVFQDACENYYAAEASVAPMVLVGVSYWTSTRAGVAAAAFAGRRAADGAPRAPRRHRRRSRVVRQLGTRPLGEPDEPDPGVRPRSRPAGRRPRRSRGRGCRGRWWGRRGPRDVVRTRARRRGRRRSTSSRAWG